MLIGFVIIIECKRWCYTIALFCDEEVVVLLAALCEDVFAV